MHSRTTSVVGNKHKAEKLISDCEKRPGSLLPVPSNILCIVRNNQVVENMWNNDYDPYMPSNSNNSGT